MREVIAGIAAGAVFCSLVAIAHSAYAYKYKKQFTVPHQIAQNIIDKHEANKPIDLLASLADKTPPIAHMQISAKGIELIKQFEGFRSSPYLLPKESRYTIAYGSTYDLNGNPVTSRHKPVSEAYGEKMMRHHIDTKIAPSIKQCLKVDVPQAFYDVVVSFAYNVGSGAACRSNVIQALNARNWIAASNALAAWDKAAGKRNNGLVIRRTKEKQEMMLTMLEIAHKLSKK